MIRIFTAIKIHPDSSVLHCIDTLKNHFAEDKINWVNPQNLHITLKYFGDTPVKKVSEISQCLQDSAQKSHSFNLFLKGTGSFGSPGQPKVLWLGIENHERLSQLYHRINKSLEALHYKADKPFFNPHITLGRIKEFINPQKLYQSLAQYADTEFQTVYIDKFYLIQSILQPKGPTYKVLDSFQLKSS